MLIVAMVLGGVVALGLSTLPIPIFFRIFEVVYLHRLIPAYNLLEFSTTVTGEAA